MYTAETLDALSRHKDDPVGWFALLTEHEQKELVGKAGSFGIGGVEGVVRIVEGEGKIFCPVHEVELPTDDRWWMDGVAWDYEVDVRADGSVHVDNDDWNSDSSGPIVCMEEPCGHPVYLGEVEYF